MFSKRMRRVIAVAAAVAVLSLAGVPASAAPRGPVAEERAEAALFSQVWQWIGDLWDAVAWDAVADTEVSPTSPGGETSLLCTHCGFDRGGAIDPNG